MKQVSGCICLSTTCINDVDEQVAQHLDITHGAVSAPVALAHASGAVADESGAARCGRKGPANPAAKELYGLFTPWVLI